MIDIVMTGRTTGTVALGITDTPGRMFVADSMMCWVDSNGGSFLQDQYMPDYSAPTMENDTQDLTLVSASEVDGVTSCTFTRRLNTMDRVTLINTLIQHSNKWLLEIQRRMATIHSS